MAGLDFLLGGGNSDQDNAARMGLLAAGLGMLANNTGHYGAAGPAIAAGGLTGLQAYQGAQDNAVQEQYKKLQMQQMQQAMARQQAQQDWLNGGGSAAPTNVSPAGSPTTQSQLSFGMNGYGQAPQATSRGVLSRSPEDLARGAALGVPGIDKIFDIYKYTKDGVKREAGNYYLNPETGEERYYTKLDVGQTMGPNGVVGTAPGYAESNARTKGMEAQAVEGAKAGLDLVQVPDGRGGAVMMPRAQAAQFLRQVPGTPMGSAAPSGGGFGATMSPADTEYENEMAKQSAGQYKSMQDAGAAAASRINNLSRINTLLGDFEGGKFTNTQTGLASAMNSLGIKIDPKLGNKEAAAALGNEMALKLRDPANGGGMPGAMSDADREFLRSMVPNASQTAEGRKLMIDAGIKVAQRDQQVAQFARQWRAKQGRLDKPDVNGLTFADHLQQWSSRNPLFPVKQ